MNLVEVNRAFLQSLLKSHSALSAWLELVAPYWDDEGLVFDCPHAAIAQVFVAHQNVLINYFRDIIPSSIITITAPGMIPIDINLDRSTTIEPINKFGF